MTSSSPTAPSTSTSTIFLDANASVPPRAEARAALLAALDVVALGGNPSSTHALGRAARRLLDTARDHVAGALRTSAKDVFFTSGATEGNRLVVDMLVAAAEKRGRPLVVATSPLEHPSLAKPLAWHAARGAFTLRTLPVVDEGVVVDVDVVRGADAVVVTGAHNETGVIVDVDAVCAAVDEDAVVVVDVSQSLGRIGPPPARVDVAVCSAHKLGGYAGAGAVMLRRRGRGLQPPWAGGGQENGVRPGTEATALLAAFGAACAVVDDVRAGHRALRPLRDRLEAAVCAAARGRAIGAGQPRLDNTSAVHFVDVDADALRMGLDQRRVAVGFGAACSALAPEPSPALVALGLSAKEARQVVRFSLAPNVDVDVDAVVAVVVDVVARARG
jgi:cysteine desulfurase